MQSQGKDGTPDPSTFSWLVHSELIESAWKWGRAAKYIKVELNINFTYLLQYDLLIKYTVKSILL